MTIRTAQIELRRRHWVRATCALAIVVAVLMPTAAFAAWQSSFAGKSQAQTGTLGAPQTLTATVASATSVTLSWSSPSPIAATKYTVVRTAGGGAVQGTCAGSVTTTTCTDTGLTSGSSYTWSVQAKAGTNWIGGTSTVSATAQLSLHVSALTELHTTQGSNSGNATVTVTVVDQFGAPLSGVTVTGVWSPTATAQGNHDCGQATNSSGQCTVTTKNTEFARPSTQTWTPNTLTKSGYTYDSAANTPANISISQA